MITVRLHTEQFMRFIGDYDDLAEAIDNVKDYSLKPHQWLDFTNDAGDLLLRIPQDSPVIDGSTYDGLRLCTRCRDRYVTAPATVCAACRQQEAIDDD